MERERAGGRRAVTPRGADRVQNGAEAAEEFAYDRGRAFAPRHA
jgi:hypothetical protein